MEGWARELLGCREVRSVYAGLGQVAQVLGEARDILRDGGVVFPLVDSAFLGTSQPAVSVYPNHWVSLLDVQNIQDAPVRQFWYYGYPIWAYDGGNVRAHIYT